jgi:hypothetical protein
LGVHPPPETVGHRRCRAHSYRLCCGDDIHRYRRCFSHGHGMGMGRRTAKVALEALPNKPETREQLR